MRCLAKNKRKMYYALHEESQTIYQTNPDGSIKYIEVDGELVPVEMGTTKEGYSEPVMFYGNIAMSSGEARESEYGIDLSAYSAVLVVDNIPITETSLIWFESEPVLKDGKADPASADYKVKKVNKSLNQSKYLLSKVEKNET